MYTPLMGQEGGSEETENTETDDEQKDEPSNRGGFKACHNAER